MPFEVELKARLRRPEETEARAAELGEFIKESFKEDIYFRRQGETQPVPIDRFRLRRETGRAVVTFKEKKMVEAGVEVNEEIEFEADNPYAFFRFAARFGFEPFVVKRKKSRVYQVGRAHVEINDVEHLGHFVEIEILCDDEANLLVARTEVARLLNDLGLSAEDLEPRYYIDLLQEAYPAHYRFTHDPAQDWPFEEILQPT